MPNVQDLINAHLVKFGTTDANFGQCTAVADAWEALLGLPFVYGNAVDIYANAPESEFVKTLNGPTNFPVVGDIVVWHQDPRVGTNQFGHVAVVVDADVNSFTVFEQNDTIGGGDGSPRLHHFSNYAGVTGWLHAHALDVVPEPTPEPVPVEPDPIPTPEPEIPVIPIPEPTEPDPTPEPTVPEPTPIVPPVKEVPVNTVKSVVTSKKFLVALLAIGTFLVNGQYDQALAVALAYLGVQGAVDHKNAG